MHNSLSTRILEKSVGCHLELMKHFFLIQIQQSFLVFSSNKNILVSINDSGQSASLPVSY